MYDPSGGNLFFPKSTSEDKVASGDVQACGIDFKSFFKDGADFVLNVFKDSLIEKVSQTKEVQDEVERQKVIAGKNIVWAYLPFILIGVVVITLIARFK